MAAADYYSCDMCGAKTFYDANLNYEEWNIERGIYEWNLGPSGDCLPVGAGDMKVICKECAKDYRVEIVKVENGD